MTTCKVCSREFTPKRPLQSVCGLVCAKKVPAKARKQRQEALKTRSQWLQEAQQAFNAWIRARDSGLGCISCGTQSGKANAGHYRSTQACPELRLCDENVHLQCERCNTYLSGNLIEYRKALIHRIGAERVEWLEGPHEPKKYTIDDLKAIRTEYRQRIKSLDWNNECN